MKKLLPLAVLLAVPAQAQEARVYYASDSWPVQAAGKTCTLSQAADADGNALSVSYDGSEVTLTSTNALESALPASGKVTLTLVFLNNDNGDIDYDDGWGPREFTYSSDNGVYHFSTRIAGERNTAQFLTDLASSKTIGFLQRGQAVVAYELTDVSRSVAQLRNCAARSVAAN